MIGLLDMMTSKQSNTQANKRQANGKTRGKRRANKKARVKWGRGKREANNVVRGIRVCDRYLVYDFCIDLPGNGVRK